MAISMAKGIKTKSADSLNRRSLQTKRMGLVSIGKPLEHFLKGGFFAIH